MTKRVAVQLYSVRDECAKDFPGTLKKIADMGYAGVELAGLHGMKPEDVAKLVSDLGMTISSEHASLVTKENLSETVERVQALGLKLLISGMGPDDLDTEEKVKKAAAAFQEAASLLKPYGIRFGIHNHWWEFTQKLDGRFVYDVLLEQAPDMFSELDVYWTKYAEVDPVQIVQHYKSRLPLLHIKDGNLTPDFLHTAVGKGKLDMPAIVQATDPAVTEWLVVELDNCATDMMEAVKESCEYITSTGLAEGKK